MSGASRPRGTPLAHQQTVNPAPSPAEPPRQIDHAAFVRRGCPAAVMTSVCLAAVWHGWETRTARDIGSHPPPPLGPQLAWLLCSAVSFNQTGDLVPPLRIPRPCRSVHASGTPPSSGASTSRCHSHPRTTFSSIAQTTPSAMDVFLHVVTKGFVTDAPLDRPEDIAITHSHRALCALLESSPCPVTQVTLPRCDPSGTGTVESPPPPRPYRQTAAGFGLRTKSLLGRSVLVGFVEAASSYSSSLSAPLRGITLAEVSFASPENFIESMTDSTVVDTCRLEQWTLQRPHIACGQLYVPFFRTFDRVLEFWSNQPVAWRRLRTVDLSMNDELSDDNIVRLASIGGFGDRLETFRAFLTPIGPRAVASLCENCPTLTELGLANCTNVNDEALRAIRSAPCNGRLRQLTLSYTGITDIGLAETAVFLPALEVLTVRGCAIGDNAIMAVAHHCPCLQHLDAVNLANVRNPGVSRSAALSNNKGLTDGAVEALATKCTHLHTLLMMNSTAVSAASLRRFAALRIRCGVERLGLRRTQADDSFMEALGNIQSPLLHAFKVQPGATFVSGFHFLRHLDLWGCDGVTDASLRILSASPALSAHLEWLDVSATSVTAEGVALAVGRIIDIQVLFHARCQWEAALRTCRAADGFPGASDRVPGGVDPHRPSALVDTAPDELRQCVCSAVRLRRLLCLSVVTHADADASARVFAEVPLLQYIRVEVAL